MVMVTQFGGEARSECGGGGEKEEEEELRPIKLADVFQFEGAKEDGQEEDFPAHDACNGNGISRKRKSDGACINDTFESFSDLPDSTASESMSVVLRVRDNGCGTKARIPCLHGVGLRSLALVPPENSNAHKAGESGSQYTFSRVFGSNTSQDQMFDEVCLPMCKSIIDGSGNGGVVMCYGITAAGKTYTIEGTTESPGLLPRSLTYLFNNMNDKMEMMLSHYEVYNDQVYDLLADTKSIGKTHFAAEHESTFDANDMKNRDRRVPLKVMEDSKGHVGVINLCRVAVPNADSGNSLLQQSLLQRFTSSTALNERSSRSHSVVTLRLHTAGDDVYKDITFVDLAGSERASRTNNNGIRLKESASINSSLMALGRCLEALRINQQYYTTKHRSNGNMLYKRVVPFRDSKITHIFRDVLQGFGKLILMVNVSAAAADYDETTHVLKYAALAAGVATTRKNSSETQDKGKSRKRLKVAIPRVAMLHHENTMHHPTRIEGEEIIKKHPKKRWANGENTTNQANFLGNRPIHRSQLTKHSRQDTAEEYTSDDETFDKSERDQKSDNAEMYSKLLHSFEIISQKLFESETKLSTLEAEIREEVAGEVAEMLKDMEKQHKTHVQCITAQYEQRLEKWEEASSSERSEDENNNRVKELGEALSMMQEDFAALEAELKETKQRSSKIPNPQSEEQIRLKLRREFDEEKVQALANMSLELETAEQLMTSTTQNITRLQRENTEMKDAIMKLLEIVEKKEGSHDGVDNSILLNFPWLGNDHKTDEREKSKMRISKETCSISRPKSNIQCDNENNTYAKSPQERTREDDDSVCKTVKELASEYEKKIVSSQDDVENVCEGNKHMILHQESRLSILSAEVKTDATNAGRQVLSPWNDTDQQKNTKKSKTVNVKTNQGDDGKKSRRKCQRMNKEKENVINVDEVVDNRNTSADGTIVELKSKTPQKKRRRGGRKLLTEKCNDQCQNEIKEALGEIESYKAVVAPTPIARRTRQRKPVHY